MTISPLAAHLASGFPLDAVPRVVDVADAAPSNPPGWLQEQFVGLSFEAAYAEADAFIAAVEKELGTLGHAGLKASRVLDFGSGWGRVSRVPLSQVAPERLFAADVDLDMTALINTTLPGINAMAVSRSQPTVLANASMDVFVAFSVFLSPIVGRTRGVGARAGPLVRPAVVVAITVLGEDCRPSTGVALPL